MSKRATATTPSAERIGTGVGTGSGTGMPEFSRRLNLLFLEHRRSDGKEWTCRDVVEAIANGVSCAGKPIGTQGYSFSWTHLAHLKRGTATNPTRNVVVGLARFFGVSPSYLVDDESEAMDPVKALTIQMLHSDPELLEFTTSVTRLSAKQRSALFTAIRAFMDVDEVHDRSA